MSDHVNPDKPAFDFHLPYHKSSYPSVECLFDGSYNFNLFDNLSSIKTDLRYPIR